MFWNQAFLTTLKDRRGAEFSWEKVKLVKAPPGEKVAMHLCWWVDVFLVPDSGHWFFVKKLFCVFFIGASLCLFPGLKGSGKI